MDAAEIRRTLVEPQLALPRVDVAVVRGDGFSDGMLVILPSGELAWLPSEALVDADEPNLVRVVRPLDALAARISACWLACEPPGNDEWIVAQFDAEYVYLQRDAGGPLHRALPEDVVGLDGYVPWQAICTPLTIDASQPAAIATAWTMFMKRLLGDGDDDLRVRSAERWTVDIPGPQVEPPSVDAAQPARADSPAAAIDASLASDAPVGPDASSARPIVEHRGREVERSAQPRRAPEPEPEPEPQYSSRVVKDPDPFVAPTAVRSSSAAPRAASEATPPRKTLIPRLATDIGGADPSSHARSIVVPPRPPRGAPPSAPERADAPHSTGSPDIAAPRPAPPSTALPRPPQRQPFAREAHLKAPPAAAEPTRLRATEAVEERKSVAPVPARDLTRFEPSAASTVASPPGPALVR